MAVRKRTPDWEDLRHFAALAEHATLSAAARELGTSHVTVARRLARLEATLGTPLFDRQDGYVLTPRGAEVLAHAQMMAGASAALGESMAGRERAPVVRLSVPRTMGDRFLVPRLSRRLQALGVELHITMETRRVSLARQEADLAVRLGQPADAEIVGRRIATIQYGLFARPDLAVASAGIIAPPERDQPDEWLWFWSHHPGRRVALRVNSQVAQLAAAEAGAGLALLPRFLVAGVTRLVEMPMRPAPPDRPIWLLARRSRLALPPIRRVFDEVRRIYREEF
ncbi:MAG: LysR family transcriptional regulator [Devosia nanyangense]|uniref:LysR family transcriptional regulator n=1 Tax=Devosia nanyangense TaxID=1228055 RepID=A0A933P0N1_9HYPH|nr:LysR family transcriptional regulator [Devosia nanyangense]